MGTRAGFELATTVAFAAGQPRAAGTSIRITIDMASYEGGGGSGGGEGKEGEGGEGGAGGAKEGSDMADAFDPSKITSDYCDKTCMLTIVMEDMVQSRDSDKPMSRRRSITDAIKGRFARAFRRGSSTAGSGDSGRSRRK